MSSLRIAYVTDQRLPNTVATSEQVVSMVAALAASGASVDLCIPERLPFPDVVARKAELLRYYAVSDGFDLVQLPELPPRKVVHGIAGALHARPRAYDVLYTRTVLAAVVGVALRRQVVLESYHVLDRHRPTTARVLARLSRSPHLLGIIAHSEQARAGMLRAGIAADKAVVFRNGYNPQRMGSTLTVTDARRRLGWNVSERVVAYTGRVDVDKGALAIVELARRTPELTYVVIGQCEAEPGWLVREAEARGCRNVRWYPPVQPSELPTYLYAADVLLIPPTAAPFETYGRTVLPLKTYLYMAARRPILGPASADVAEVLNDDNAVLVAPDDHDAAAVAVRRLTAEPQWAQTVARNAASDVLDLTWERRASRILTWIEEHRALGG